MMKICNLLLENCSCIIKQTIKEKKLSKVSVVLSIYSVVENDIKMVRFLLSKPELKINLKLIILLFSYNFYICFNKKIKIIYIYEIKYKN